MKVVRRLQEGGSMFRTAVYTDYSGSRAGGASASPAATSGKKEEEGIDKVLYKELASKGGLTNDTYALTAELSKSMALQEHDILGFSDNTSKTIGLIGKVNELRRNLDSFNTAQKTAVANGGYGEIATDEYGRVYARNTENKIQSYSLSEFQKNKDKIQAMTVSELFTAREKDPSLVNNTSVFTIGDNAIGMDKISDHIKEIVGLVKQDIVTSESYTTNQKDLKDKVAKLAGKQPTQEQLQGLMALAAAPDGMYKKTETTKGAGGESIKAAYEYIWKSFGRNAQNKLKAVAIQNGDDDPTSLIKNLLTATHNTEQDVKYDQVKDKDGNGVKADGTSSKTVSRSPMELAITGGFNRPGQTHTINNPKTGSQMQVQATYVGGLMSLKTDGAPIAPKKISKVIFDDGYGQIIDPNNAFLGDQKINVHQLQEMVYSGQDVARVMIPTDSSGNPDMGSLEDFQKVNKQFEENRGNLSTQQAEKMFRDAGFRGVKIQEVPSESGGTVKVVAESNNVKPFWGMPVLTNSASDLSASPWMVPLHGSEADAADLTMESAFTEQGGTNSKPTFKNTAPSGWFSLEKPMSSMVYFKERPNASGVLASRNNNMLGKPAYEEDMRRNLQYSGQPTSMTNASANKLLND